MEQVSETAQERAHQVREQANTFATEWRAQMSERSLAMRDRGVTALRSLAAELRQMAAAPTGSSETAHRAARSAADRIDAICADLERREPGDLMLQARAYARSHPTQVMVAMFAAGALVGRLMYGMSSHRSDGQTIDLRAEERRADYSSDIPDVGYIE